MFAVACFVGLGKLAGAAKEIAIAYRFGTDAVVDHYLFVLALLLWLPTVWGSVANSVCVPLLGRLAPAQGRRFLGELSAALLILGTGSMLFVWTLSPLLAEPVAALLGSTGWQTTHLLVVLVPAVPMLLLISQYNAQLLARERHVNTLLGGLPACLLLGVLLLWPGRFDTTPLVLGTLLGYLAQLLWLGRLLQRRGELVRPQVTLRSDGWPGFRSAMSVMVVSQVIINVVPLLDQVIAAGLPSGSIATLGYATRFLSLFLGIGAIAVARAILPVLSSGTEGRRRTRIALRWFALLFLLGLVAAAVLWWIAPGAVRLMYERGAFLPEDTRLVTDTVRFGLTQLPFYFAGIVLVQLFASERAFTILLGSSVIAVLLKLGLGYPLAAAWGVPGIALSTGLMYLGTFLFLSGCAVHRLHRERAGQGPRA